MTFFSFWLEARLGVGVEQKRLKHDLPPPPGKSERSFGPYFLQDWAKREDLDIDYIDNCFLKVAAPRQKVIDLLSEIYGPRALCGLIESEDS